MNKDQQVQNASPHLSPPRINNLNNDTKSLIPDDFFSLMDELADEPDEQDDEEVILPKITICKKRGRPVGSRNKVYEPVLDDQKYSTRSKSKHTGFAVPGIAKAFAIDELDDEFTNLKNRYGIYNFSFDDSYKDSDGNEDPDYVDENINDDLKATFHYIFNTGAQLSLLDPETLEEAMERPD
jgi:hypothetical protein